MTGGEFTKDSKMLKLIVTMLSFGLASGGLALKPINMAKVVGESVTFTCTVDSYEPGTPQWSKSNVISLTTFTSITSGSSSSSGTYTIVENGKSSSLTISNLGTSDAVFYLCQPLVNLNGYKAYAELVIIAAAPSCTTTPDLTTAVSDMDAVTACRVEYHSPTGYGPNFEWRVITGAAAVAPVSTETTETTGSAAVGFTLTSTYTETIACAFQGRTYKAEVGFPSYSTTNLPDQSWDFSEIVATYAYVYTSAAVDVFCKLSTVTISPGPYFVGGTITCSAGATDGTPTGPVTYTWTHSTNVEAPGASFKIVPTLKGTQTFICTATQTHGGSSYSKLVEMTANVSGSENVRPAPYLPMFLTIISFVYLLLWN